MSPLFRIARRFAITLAVLAVPLLGFSAEPEQLILGKWQHVSSLRTIDGQAAAPQISDGKSFAEFFPNGTFTLKSPSNLAGGTFRWLDAGRMEQTILESGLAIQVGIVSIKQIRVTADKLEIITVQTAADMEKFMPPAKPGVRRPNEVVITSNFSRAP